MPFVLCVLNESQTLLLIDLPHCSLEDQVFHMIGWLCNLKILASLHCFKFISHVESIFLLVFSWNVLQLFLLVLTHIEKKNWHLYCSVGKSHDNHEFLKEDCVDGNEYDWLVFYIAAEMCHEQKYSKILIIWLLSDKVRGPSFK